VFYFKSHNFCFFFVDILRYSDNIKIILKSGIILISIMAEYTIRALLPSLLC